MTTSRRDTVASTTALPRPGPPRVPNDRLGDGAISAATRGGLDRLLEVLEQRQLSAAELRMLLRLLDREMSLSELAQTLGTRPVEIRRAGWRLAMHGLVRWGHAGRRKETRLGITADGLATMRALLTAAGEAGTPGTRRWSA